MAPTRHGDQLLVEYHHKGAVLGPMLFVLYINGMSKVVSEGSDVFLFADDTKNILGNKLNR